MAKKAAESKPLFSVAIKPPEKPVALYFLPRENGKDAKPAFDERSHDVAKLAIEPVEGDAEGGHWLRRFDKDDKPVWSTRHPSLQETFWYAEWEYGVTEAQWTKP